MKKLIYIFLGVCLTVVASSCTEAVASTPLTTEYGNVKTIAEYKMSIYCKVNVSTVEYNGRTFLVTTAYSGSPEGGISVNTIELK